MRKFLVGLVLVFPSLAFAVAGRFDVGNYHFKNYENRWQKPASSWVQWVNTDDWVVEMRDIASLHTEKDPRDLETRVFKEPDKIFDYDIVFFKTHGSGGGSGASAWANLYAWEHGSRIDMLKAGTVHDEMEILLLQACNVLAKSSATDWYVLRNLHRKGAVVTAGAYSSVWTVNTVVNTTFNQLGDEIVHNHKIKNAWLHAHDLLFEAKNDDLKVDGLGAIGEDNCDNRARNVNRKNRLDYTKYSYAYDLGPNRGFEICGYYWADY